MGGAPGNDVGDDHVQPGAVREHRVDERRRHVDPATRRPQHPLDQVGELAGTEDRRRELAAPPPGDEQPAGLVDPELTPDARARAVIDGTEV